RDRWCRVAGRRAGFPGRRRHRRPGRHRDLRRPDTARATRRRARSGMPASGPRHVCTAHRDGVARQDRRAVGQGRGVPTVTTLLPTVSAAARAAAAARTEALFRESGALTEGHFLLKSGRHSDRYLEKFQVLQYPAATSELCSLWTAGYRRDDGTLLVD